ncbi:hypothetical protein Tco_0020950, partial [Tanacetum coccineum]
GPHETYQCQPMNKDYYHEQKSCYDPNSFGFDQFHPSQYTVNLPIFNAQNELLNSQNEIMEQMTSICDMIGQYMQKKEEEKRITEELPPCVAIIPVLSTEEPVDSLIMEDEHLDTISVTESDELIKSSVEKLVQIPNQFEGFFDSNDDSTSIDDDSFSIDDIDYVEASPPDSELVSLEEVKDEEY